MTIPISLTQSFWWWILLSSTNHLPTPWFPKNGPMSHILCRIPWFFPWFSLDTSAAVGDVWEVFSTMCPFGGESARLLALCRKNWGKCSKFQWFVGFCWEVCHGKCVESKSRERNGIYHQLWPSCSLFFDGSDGIPVLPHCHPLTHKLRWKKNTINHMKHWGESPRMLPESQTSWSFEVVQGLGGSMA